MAGENNQNRSVSQVVFDAMVTSINPVTGVAAAVRDVTAIQQRINERQATGGGEASWSERISQGLAVVGALPVVGGVVKGVGKGAQVALKAGEVLNAGVRGGVMRGAQQAALTGAATLATVHVAHASETVIGEARQDDSLLKAGLHASVAVVTAIAARRVGGRVLSGRSQPAKDNAAPAEGRADALAKPAGEAQAVQALSLSAPLLKGPTTGAAAPAASQSSGAPASSTSAGAAPAASVSPAPVVAAPAQAPSGVTYYNQPTTNLPAAHRLIERAGERHVPGPNSGQLTLDASITRQLDMRDALPVDHPVRVRAASIEAQFIYEGAPNPPVGQHSPVAAEMKQYGHALAFCIANNPVADATWTKAVEGKVIANSGKDSVPGTVTLSFRDADEYGVTEAKMHKKGEPIAPTPITIYNPTSVKSWHDATILLRMATFVHEGRHADTDVHNHARRTRTAPLQVHEYSAERRAVMALDFEAQRAEIGDAAKVRRPTVEQRLDVGRWVLEGYPSALRNGMGHSRIEPDLYNYMHATANSLSKNGKSTISEASRFVEGLDSKVKDVSSRLSVNDLEGSTEGKSFSSFKAEFDLIFEKAKGEYDSIVNTINDKKTKPAHPDELRKKIVNASSLTQADMAQLTARFEQQRQGIDAMLARPPELRHDIINAQYNQYTDLFTLYTTPASSAVPDGSVNNSNDAFPSLGFPPIEFP